MNENHVWSLVKAPKDQKPVNCKWVFKKKLAADGSISSYKARLVAQGFTQQYGVNYDETFAPVVRFESVRSLLSLAAEKGLLLHQMDVSAAFLNGELDEEIYMSQPQGFIIPGKENLVCKLQKSLYGLKQSPRCWNTALDGYLQDIGFENSKSDSCIYIRNRNNSFCVVAVYVDDLIIASKSIDEIETIKKSMNNRYKMKDLGALKYFLGINIMQDENNVFINQSSYIESLLGKFNFSNANPVKSPVECSIKLVKANESSDLCDVTLYQSAVGSLLYLSTKTRPDITFAVSNVARYCQKPTQQHWSAVKRIFRYLKGTIDFGIKYSKNPQGGVGVTSDKFVHLRNLMGMVSAKTLNSM